MKKILLAVTICASIFFLSGATPAFAAATDRTWNGGGADNKWQTGDNWGGTAPSEGDGLVFAGSTQLDPDNNFGEGTTFTGILIADGSGAFVTSGNGITVTGRGATSGSVTGEWAVLNNNSSNANTQTIGNKLTLQGSLSIESNSNTSLLKLTGDIVNDGAQTLTVKGAAGGVEINGAISGSGNLTKSGTSTNILTLTGTNTYTGTTAVNSGTLIAKGNAAALGAGALTMSGGKLQLVDNSGLAFNRNTTVSSSSEIDSLRSAGAGAGSTNTLGTLSINGSTLTVGLGDALTTSGTQGLTFGDVTLTGNATIATASDAGGTATGLLTLGAVTGAGRNFTITGTEATTITGAMNTNNSNGNAGGAVSVTQDGEINIDSTVSTRGGNSSVPGGTAVAGAGGSVTINSTAAATAVDGAIDTTGGNASAMFSATGGAGGAVNITAGTSSTNGNITTRGGNASVNLTSIGGAGGNVTINAGTTAVVGAVTTKGGDATFGMPCTSGAGGNVDITAGTSITLNGDINATCGDIGGITPTYGAGGYAHLHGATILGTDISISTTGSTNGEILFADTLNGTTDFADNLSLTAGSANVTFSGAVGGTKDLGALLISSAGTTEFASTVAAASLHQDSGTTTILRNNVTTTTATGVDITATNITLDGLTIDTSTGDGVARFAGATTLSSGAVNITGGTGAIDFTGTVNTGGQILTINNAATGVATISGAVSGTGGLVKSGAGALHLDGNNTFTTGGITLNDGTLNLGSTTALGASGSTFTINGGTIDADAGSLVMANNNAIDINSNFTFTGTNDLDLGTGGVRLLTGSPTITVDGNTLTVGGAIDSGAWGITKAGAGALTLNGNNTYAGGTTINAGTLNVGNANAVGTGALTNNATLNVGAISLTLGDAYTQSAGAILALTVNSSSSFGCIISTVAAVVDAASTIAVTVGGSIPRGTTFKIIDTLEKGIGAAPGTVTSTDPSLTFRASIFNNDLILTAFGNNILSSVGATLNPNAATVGAVMDSVTNPSADMTTVINALNTLSDSQGASSLNSMIPTVDGALLQSAISMLHQITGSTEAHLENIRTAGQTGVSTGDSYLHGLDIWARVLGDYAHQDPRGFSSGYNATSWGVSGGADIPLNIGNDMLRMGIGCGYGQTFVRSKDSSGRNDIDSIPGTLYASYENDKYPFYLDSAFTFIYNTYNTSRAVTVGTLTQRTASADYNGQQYSTYLEGGYSFFYKNLRITPLTSFQYMHLHTASYTESGAGALNLSVNSQDYDMAMTGLGAKVACPFESKYGTIIPDLHAKWLYDWVGDNQATTAAFAGGGSAFPTSGFRTARSTYDMGTRVSIKTKYDISLDLDYDFLLKAQYYEHYGSVAVKYSF